MCPSQNQQQRSTTSTYSPTSSTSNLAYHHPQSSSQELLKVDDAHSFMDCSMNNPADISKSNNDLTTGNQNADPSRVDASSLSFNPSMMMMLQQQPQQQVQQQEQFHADNFSAPHDATSGTFAPSGQQHQQGFDATGVSSMLFSLSNDMNNGMPSSYNQHQDQQVQQQQINQLPPKAMVQAFQDHHLHHHQNGMNPSMNTIVSSSINNDRAGNVMSMSSNQSTTSAGNFVETNPQQQMQMQMQMQSMVSMMPAIPPAIAQQLLIQLQQQGQAALPSIALLTNSLGSTCTVINNPAATQQQEQQLPPAQPSSSSAAASATGVPPRPKKVGRRGDPRMHEAVRYRLAHPKCTLLDALLHGGFSFPPLHLVNISDRFVRDANGVTLSQRKNQLMRRLRVIEKGEQSNDANNNKKKVSSKKKKKKDDDDSSKSGDDGSTGTKSKGSGDDEASSDGDCGASVAIDAPAVPSSSMALPPQQVQVPVMLDTAAVMVPSLPTSSSEGQGQASEMEQQIRNQLLINQLKMVLLQQQIQEQAQAQAQNQQRDQQQQQQQITADETLMSLQTDTSAPTEERAADERNAKSA